MESADWITPGALEDITEEWVYHFIFHFCNLPKEKRKDLTIQEIKIQSGLNAGEGALSEICHVSVSAHAKDKLNEEIIKEHVVMIENYEKDNNCQEARNSPLCDEIVERVNVGTINSSNSNENENEKHNENKNSLNEIHYYLFIKLLPKDLRHLINKHRLFQREILMYR